MFVRSENMVCCNQVNAALESVHSQVAGALRQNFENLTGKLEGTKAALRGEIERVNSILSRNQLQ